MLRLLPSLEHEYAPELVLQITISVLMCTPCTSDRRGVEESLLRKTPLIEEGLSPVFEWPPKPAIDGHAESHLRPLD